MKHYYYFLFWRPRPVRLRNNDNDPVWEPRGRLVFGQSASRWDDKIKSRFVLQVTETFRSIEMAGNTGGSTKAPLLLNNSLIFDIFQQTI